MFNPSPNELTKSTPVLSGGNKVNKVAAFSEKTPLLSFLSLQPPRHKVRLEKQSKKYERRCINFIRFKQYNKHLCQHKYTGIDDKRS